MSIRAAFLLLVLAQATHSIEEYVFRLYDRLAPAHYVSMVLGLDPPAGFAIANTALVLLGLWCWAVPVRKGIRPVAWAWSLLEIANGFAHVALAFAARGYFPGLATVPLLLGASAWLITRLTREA